MYILDKFLTLCLTFEGLPPPLSSIGPIMGINFFYSSFAQMGVIYKQKQVDV
jgi:hypothetical protein